MKYRLRKGEVVCYTDNKTTRDLFVKHGFKVEEDKKKKTEKKESAE